MRHLQMHIWNISHIRVLEYVPLDLFFKDLSRVFNPHKVHHQPERPEFRKDSTHFLAGLVL